jgi:hypothetical protein
LDGCPTKCNNCEQDPISGGEDGGRAATLFGIGGRDIAAAELEKWIRSMKSKQE